MLSGPIPSRPIRINAIVGALVALCGFISPATIGPAPQVANATQAMLIIDAGGDEWETYSHTCVLKNGALQCVGSNGYGQLGDGTTTNSATPVEVQGLGSGVTAIELGAHHSCAIVSGTVKCWGRNQFGQLGDGTTVDSAIPVSVSGLSGVTSLQVGADHSCVTWTNSQTSGVKCWGWNQQGQLGNAIDLNDQQRPLFSSTPVDVIGISTSTALALGVAHSCALASGAVKCWGENTWGALGDGTTISSATPVAVGNLSNGNVTAITSGGYHACALNVLGGLKCWGWGEEGELGDGNQVDVNPVPVQVLGLTSGVISVDAGDFHTCAILSSDEVKCWGYGLTGQVIDGTTQDQLSPQSVPNSAGITSLSLGNYFTCATTATNVKCWGSNLHNQLVNDITGWNFPSSLPNGNLDSPASNSIPAPVFTFQSRPLVSAKGQLLTLLGENLGDIYSIKVGGKEAKIISKSAGEIVIDVPAGSMGYVDVEVVSSFGKITMQELLHVVKPYAHKRTQRISQFSGNLPTKSGLAAIRQMYLKSPSANLLSCVSIVAENASASQVAIAKNRAKATCQSVIKYSKFIKSADIQVSKTGKAGAKLVLAVTFDRTLSGS